MSSRQRGRHLAFFVVAVALLGCSPRPQPPADAPVPAVPAVAAPTAPKVLTIGQNTIVKTYGLREFSNPSGGGAALVEIHTAGLVTQDLQGGPEPRLAASLPSLQDGTIVLLPDGRMETTWKLRPNVKWHDGAPFTSEDVVFSVDAARRMDVQSGTASLNRQVESVRAPDPLTAVVTWRTTFYRALDMSYRTLWLYPRRLLGEALEGDREAFEAQPYFTTQYVHLGPFRLVDFGLGEQQVFERFDGYFLGRPKIDRIIIRSIQDGNAMLANLKAGAIDMASESTLPGEVVMQVREEWRQSGGGTVHDRQDNWRSLWVQFDPQWAKPIELSQDPRLRRGLLLGFDRYAVSEFLFPGFPNSRSDSFLLKSDARGEVVGQPFAAFTYDAVQAARSLAEGGWNRAADGRLLGRDGQQVQIEFRSGGQQYVREAALIADYWRQIGMEVSELVESPAQARDNEYQARFTGLSASARGTGDGVFVNLDGRLQSGPENRWTGANIAHYSNASLDAQIDRLQATLDLREQGQRMKEMASVLVDELPVMPLYFRIGFAATGRGVNALTADYPGTIGSGFMARNAHQWDRD
ncbi:MAG: hypothetical protein HW416_1345 [Chloroflexi bacterium]|nr:hypothetical protein [Chloroflexota bacterium]